MLFAQNEKWAESFFFFFLFALKLCLYVWMNEFQFSLWCWHIFAVSIYPLHMISDEKELCAHLFLCDTLILQLKQNVTHIILDQSFDGASFQPGEWCAILTTMAASTAKHRQTNDTLTRGSMDILWYSFLVVFFCLISIWIGLIWHLREKINFT